MSVMIENQVFFYGSEVPPTWLSKPR